MLVFNAGAPAPELARGDFLARPCCSRDWANRRSVAVSLPLRRQL